MTIFWGVLQVFGAIFVVVTAYSAMSVAYEALDRKIRDEEKKKKQ